MPAGGCGQRRRVDHLADVARRRAVGQQPKAIAGVFGHAVAVPISGVGATDDVADVLCVPMDKGEIARVIRVAQELGVLEQRIGLLAQPQGEAKRAGRAGGADEQGAHVAQRIGGQRPAEHDLSLGRVARACNRDVLIDAQQICGVGRLIRQARRFPREGQCAEWQRAARADKLRRVGLTRLRRG
jgi:hypothetical protein